MRSVLSGLIVFQKRWRCFSLLQWYTKTKHRPPRTRTVHESFLLNPKKHNQASGSEFGLSKHVVDSVGLISWFSIHFSFTAMFFGGGGSSKAKTAVLTPPQPIPTCFEEEAAALQFFIEGNKPRVLVLGGVGMIGRQLLRFLIENELCSSIRVADKVMPVMGYLHPSLEALYEHPIVEYVQTDLTKEAHLQRAFVGPAFDFVFNLAAETRYGQTPAVYQSRCTDLSRLVATKARDQGVARFIEVSTALVYKSQTRRAATETSDKEPCTAQGIAKLEAEREVLSILSPVKCDSKTTECVIVRPAFVYGPGDILGIMPRVICAAAYAELEETMKFLWDARTRINTVHVFDVVRALWLVATRRDVVPAGSIWNLCDEGDSDQGKLNEILGKIFDIKTGFHGPILSAVASLRMADVVETANEKHLTPWDDLCRRHGISNTPLSPFMSRELLENKHVFVDGTAFCRATGFVYSIPRLTEATVRASIEHAIEAKIFPPVLV